MDSNKENDVLNKIPKIEDEIKGIKRSQKKILKIIKTKTTWMIIAIILLSIMFTTSIVNNAIQISINREMIEETKVALSKITSAYEIENLKGEKINTFVSWKIEPDDPFHIHVVNSPNITQEQLDMINDIIYSTDIVELTDGTYYKGWFGALQSSSYKTKFPVPIHYHSAITDTGAGHITIRLTTQSSGDGYSGYTKNQVDEVNHQILKSQIIIYSVDKLSREEFKAIVRHELGHAFGLAHSHNPDDLMYPEIRTNYPYISPCDVYGILELYDGEQKSEIICQ